MGELGFIFISCEASCLFIPSEESPSSHGDLGDSRERTGKLHCALGLFSPLTFSTNDTSWIQFSIRPQWLCTFVLLQARSDGNSQHWHWPLMLRVISNGFSGFHFAAAGSQKWLFSVTVLWIARIQSTSKFVVEEMRPQCKLSFTEPKKQKKKKKNSDSYKLMIIIILPAKCDTLLYRLQGGRGK